MQNAKLWGKNYKFLVAVDIIDERRETRDESDRPHRLSATSPNLGEEIKPRQFVPSKLGGRAKRRGYVKS